MPVCCVCGPVATRKPPYCVLLRSVAPSHPLSSSGLVMRSHRRSAPQVNVLTYLSCGARLVTSAYVVRPIPAQCPPSPVVVVSGVGAGASRGLAAVDESLCDVARLRVGLLRVAVDDGQSLV